MLLLDSPLVRTQAAVCRRQQRLQVGVQLIQLHGEAGEAVVQQVVLRLGVCGWGGRRKQVFGERQGCVAAFARACHRLTWLPDAFRGGQSVAEDAFVPQPSEPVNDAAALVQHRALHLVLVRFRAPVTRLPRQKNTNSVSGEEEGRVVRECGLIHLDEGDLAGADVAFEVADGDLSVMLQVALLTEDVVDAGHYFVPLIVVSVPGNKTGVKQSTQMRRNAHLFWLK